MASHFNNDDITDVPVVPQAARPGSGGEPFEAAGAAVVAPAAAPAVPQTAVVSEAVIKFRSCRWRRPPDEGVECCGHRDVLPIAGTTSFVAEAWCPECAYFKLRRVPKKREYY